MTLQACLNIHLLQQLSQSISIKQLSDLNLKQVASLFWHCWPVRYIQCYLEIRPRCQVAKLLENYDIL